MPTKYLKLGYSFSFKPVIQFFVTGESDSCMALPDLLYREVERAVYKCHPVTPQTRKLDPFASIAIASW